MKKKTLIILGVLIICLIAIYGSVKNSYNQMVVMQEGVTSAWGNVENQYQRRYDLIPNLVNTVKGYATHEQETLEAVIQARANATKMTINVDNLNEQNMEQFNKAQGELSGALSRLLAVSESYPDLKANQNFLDLQAQLEGTENRISTERKRYNDSAQQYNTQIKMFPRNILANVFGFEVKPYFKSDEAAQKAPEVKF